MTAMDIYQQDEALRLAGQPLPSRQQYYCELRDALHHELIRDGYSTWLDLVVTSMRQHTLTDIYVLDYAALTECHSLVVNSQKLRDATDFIPHLLKRGQRVSWDAVETGTNYLPADDGMLEKFRTLRTVSRQIYEARMLPQGESGDSAKEAEQLQSLARMLDERCKALEAERDALKERIAQLEAGAIDARLSRLIREKREVMEADLDASYEAQRHRASEAFREQYALEMADRTAAIQDAARMALDAQHCWQQERRSIREDMAADLQRLEKRITTQIAKWQSALDRSEYRMLAASFAAIAPLLTDALDDLAIEAQCRHAAPALMDRIARCQGEAADRLHQLEQALLRLGLIAIRPAPGDPFDGSLHAPVSASQQGMVERCIRPGVLMEDTGEVLIQAEVVLTPNE